MFDLPQLYTKPSSSVLLPALALLAIQPPSWDRTTPSKRRKSKPQHPRIRVHPEGVTGYLTKIVASSLRWIEDDEEKERIWEAASLRLAERSGRTAMPAMERTFTIPINDQRSDVELVIHEPALTADNLGLKTWAASFMLAKRLQTLHLPSLKRRDLPNQAFQVLELGSGTGLVGMAAAAVLGTGALLTDLPEIEANLARNVEANRSIMEANGGHATTAVLDWSAPSALHPTATIQALDTRRGSLAALDGISTITKTEAALPTPPDSALATPAALPTSFPVILAADCIYDSGHPAMLVSVVSAWLSKSEEARLVIELPLRDAYLGDVEALKNGMNAIGLDLLDQGHEVGVDDWGAEDDIREVRCWWGIWKWSALQSSKMSKR